MFKRFAAVGSKLYCAGQQAHGHIKSSGQILFVEIGLRLGLSLRVGIRLCSSVQDQGSGVGSGVQGLGLRVSRGGASCLRTLGSRVQAFRAHGV